SCSTSDSMSALHGDMVKFSTYRDNLLRRRTASSSALAVSFDFTRRLLQLLFEPMALFFGDELLHCVQFNGLRRPAAGLDPFRCHLQRKCGLYALSQHALELQFIGPCEKHASMRVVAQHQPHRLQAKEMAPAAIH